MILIVSVATTEEHLREYLKFSNMLISDHPSVSRTLLVPYALLSSAQLINPIGEKRCFSVHPYPDCFGSPVDSSRYAKMNVVSILSPPSDTFVIYHDTSIFIEDPFSIPFHFDKLNIVRHPKRSLPFLELVYLFLNGTYGFVRCVRLLCCYPGLLFKQSLFLGGIFAFPASSAPSAALFLDWWKLYQDPLFGGRDQLALALLLTPGFNVSVHPYVSVFSYLGYSPHVHAKTMSMVSLVSRVKRILSR